MNETAKALEALDRIFNYCEEIDLHIPKEEQVGYDMLVDITIIREALVNQKTGHWINRHNIYANKTFDTKVCSECQYEYSHDAETGISNANFCPNCGAKMEGE